MFHKEFPFGRGLWVWHLDKCEGGNIDAMINKCHTYNITYLLIKTGDGGRMWSQLNRDIVSRFQNAGIKIYSWTFNYGYNNEASATPESEAQIAIKSLDLGVNGHIFNAETKYEELDNNHQVAETMLKMVRAKYPDKFLAHAPFAFISVHSAFPYETFGRYCDAVMPQIYWGTMGRTPHDAMSRTYNDFLAWENRCKAEGKSDCIKPMIPVGQGYDIPNRHKLDGTLSPFYVLPDDLRTFINYFHGYKSVLFWSWEHLFRADCWTAIHDATLDNPTDADRGIVVVAHEEPKPVQVTTEAPVSVIVEPPAVPLAPVEAVPEVASEQTVTVIGIDQDGTHVEEVVAVPIVETPTTTYILSGVTSTVAETPQVVPQQTAPQKIELSPAESSTSVNVGQKTTIVLDPDANHPDGVKMTVTTHKTHQEYFIDFIVYLLSLFLKK